MAVYILPEKVIVVDSKMSYPGYLDVKRHKKSIYDYVVKNEKEMKRLLERSGNKGD